MCTGGRGTPRGSEGMHGFGERRYWRNAPAECGREQRLEAIDDEARRHCMVV